MVNIRELISCECRVSGDLQYTLSKLKAKENLTLLSGIIFYNQ